MNELGMSSGLGAAAFARAFPFYLRLDRGLRVRAVGASLAATLPGLRLSDLLAEHFEVRRPRNAETIEDFRLHGTHLVTLRARARDSLSLRGSAEMLDDGGLLLVVAPIVTSLDALHGLGLDFGHFARHDGVADLLLMARTMETSLRDAERMATRLQARTAQLDTILELGQNGVAAFDEAGVLRHTNRALRDMLQLEKTDAIGLTLADMERRLQVLRDPSADLTPLFADTVEDDIPKRQIMLAVPRPAVLRVSSRRSPEGGRIFYLRDVTAETEVDRMKTEFLSTAAHELRTPMVSVFGFTELLLNRPVGELQRREMLHTIHRQSGLLITMVNELLDLARIEARQGKDLHRAAHALGPLVGLAVDGQAAREDGRAVTLDLRHADAVVSVDAEKLHRVMNNVLSNAFKYSPAGGEVRLDTLDGELDGRPAVGVRVRDQGIGMTPGELSRVFDRFYRADPSGHIPGTGLGMSLVREIMTLHGGRIDLQSTPGQGTTVTLWWPLAEVLQPA
jgi:signal transduction histidine kinase